MARVERHLAAILVGDVVAYSRLMGADEEGTLAKLNAHRREFLDPTIAKYRGRVVKRTGDGFLTEFGSAVDATRCAVQTQRGMAQRNASVPADRRIEIRIGIHVGDVIIEEGDIFGDGVNIAARLESLAPPGGICISDGTYQQVRGKLDVNFDDMGEQELKNIDHPVHVYRFNPNAVLAEAKSIASQSARGKKPSIAILPFQNMSGDPEQEYFGDGLAEDIITSLSKARGLFVIARNSTFTYKNKAVDIRRIARELGVQFVLEGSVRRSGGRLRVTAQLNEAASSNQIWAERYDRPVGDLFDVQDEITREIVLALSIELTAGERALVISRSTRNLEAWLETMQGFEYWGEGSPKGNRQARTHFERAVSIDPKYTIAWAFIGWTHYMEARFGFSADPRASVAKASEIAEKCIGLSPDDPHGHGLRAGVLVVQGRFQEAVRESEIAVNGSPGDALLWVISARVLITAGDADGGAAAIREAMQLDPFRPTYYRGLLANALEELGRDDEAIQVLTESVRRDPDYFSGHLRLASLYGLGDRIDAARAALATALRINPRFIMAMAEAFYASSNKESTERFKLGLRKAGLPD